MGKFPNGWIEISLGEVIVLVGGGTPKTSISSNWNGKIPWLSVVDFNNDNRWVSKTEKSITDAGLNNSSTKLLNTNDIIISARGTVGALAQLKKPMAFNQSCYGIKEKTNISNINFLYYLIKFSLKKISKNVHGAVFDTITRQTFNNININLPPLPEQQSIANLLSSFDEKIELLQEQNETLETIAQTIFKEWLSEKNSSNWEYKQLDEVLEITSSKRIFYDEYVDNGIPFYRSKEIIELSEKPNISTELFITKKRFEEIKNKFSVPTKGDILLTSVGTLGVSYQVRNNNNFYFKDGNLTWFKNFSDDISSDYVYYWLKLQSTQNQLNLISIGSTQRALTIKSLKTLQIPILKNKRKQVQIFCLLESIIRITNHNHSQIHTLTKTRNTLMPKLMNGSVIVGELWK